MSLLAEVISAANKVEVNTLVTKMPELMLLVETSKKELLNYLDNVFIKYSQPPCRNTNFSEKVKSAKVTLSQLEQSVNELTKQSIENTELDLVSSEKKITETKEKIIVLNSLIDIHNNVLDAKDYLKKEKYTEVIKLVQDTKQNISSLQLDASLIILESLQKQILDVEVQLFTEMNNKVYQYIQYDLDGDLAYFGIEEDNILENLLSSYTLWDNHIPILNDIARFLWDNIFCPIVNFTVSIKVIFEEDKKNEKIKTNKLQIQVLDEGAKSSYNEVFDNIIMVIDFFEEHFKYTLENCTTLEYIGKDFRDNLCELLIKNCLNDTIPINSEQLQHYDLVIKEVDKLQSKLIRCGFFSESMTSLLDHASNVDEHYIRKKCEMYMKAAKKIMRKDLHNMVEVGQPVDLSLPLKIDQNVFYQRSVSSSCLELLEFTENVLKQIFKTSQSCGKLLYHTTRMIFAEYGDQVSAHHQKLLQTIPQQVALFLNNCTYLSYKLTSWNEIYGAKIKQTLNIEENIFSTEVQSLSFIGNKTFDEFVEQQIKQIDQIVKESGLVEIHTLEQLEPITEKSIRQCLRQQELLRTVWNKVLSYSDYNKTLGITLNFLCKSLINAILNIQDISSKAGDQLVDVLKIIFTRGPKLFTDQKDVLIYVEEWYKLNELSFLLSSNLLEISDRWADGKGPLALQFKSDELKQLIKALFQNTDRRAAVLARIKDIH